MKFGALLQQFYYKPYFLFVKNGYDFWILHNGVNIGIDGSYTNSLTCATGIADVTGV